MTLKLFLSRRLAASTTLASLMLAGCAHSAQTGREGAAGAAGAITEAMVREAIQERLSVLPTNCAKVPTGDHIGRAGEEIRLRPVRAGDGTEAFDPEALRQMDALVAVGLYSVQSQIAGTGPFARQRVRAYSLTPFGRDFHVARDKIGLNAFHGGFCYGRRMVLELIRPDLARFQRCRSGSVEFTFADVGFPDWIEHPAIRAAFPDMLRKRDENVVRYGRINLVESGGRLVERSYEGVIVYIPGEEICQ